MKKKILIADSVRNAIEREQSILNRVSFEIFPGKEKRHHPGKTTQEVDILEIGQGWSCTLGKAVQDEAPDRSPQEAANDRDRRKP